MNENNMVVQMTIGDLKRLIKDVVEEVIKQKDNKKPKKDKAENYTTPPTDYANSGMDPIDCAKANMYKPK